jgi:hypothetical protein
MASVAEALNHSCPTNRSIVLPHEASRSDAASQSAMTIIVFLRHLETNTSRGLLLTCWNNQTNRRPFDMSYLAGMLGHAPRLQDGMRCPCKATPV